MSLELVLVVALSHSCWDDVFDISTVAASSICWLVFKEVGVGLLYSCVCRIVIKSFSNTLWLSTEVAPICHAWFGCGLIGIVVLCMAFRLTRCPAAIYACAFCRLHAS